MPTFDQYQPIDPPKKGKIIKSAYDSESFESDGTIHVDGLVGSATISPSGRDIALASPDGLAIIDLDAPYNPPRRLRTHGLPWLVTDVQWSPFAARDYWVVSTANHRALVWNLNLREDSSSGAIEHSLQGHSRAITDINFSAHHPDILATCSVDGYVHSWDLRRPRQPVLTFCDWFAGATQVKYSRQQPHVLASSHDRWLHVWDERRACEPSQSISAHTSKIYGLDWNRTNPTAIVTCSLDKSIKFWDYSKSTEEPENVIHTEYPVWRARHTPFGDGLLAMPQNEPGDLYLYDQRRIKEAPKHASIDPIAVFPGHGHNKAQEFLWRSRGGITEDNIDTRDFQLVSWGADNELRLQCIDTNILSAVGYTKDTEAAKGINLTRKGATYKSFRAVDDNISRDRKAGTMSDPRAVQGHSSRQSALTLSMRSGAQGQKAQKGGWHGPSMKAKSKGKKDRNQSQISWLKGITITKRKVSGPGILPKRQMSKDSSVFGHGYPDDDWGEPDTVQAELLQISRQIPKVKWENIDLDNLTLKASLNGPWGADGETIFIKVKIDIPEDYPESAAPKFFIGKTSFLPEETHQRITREIHQLADQFLGRKQNCLEVAFTYLLGEVDLESSTTFFKNVRDLDDDIHGLVDESSSSEEDENIPTGGSAAMSQELVPPNEAETALAPPNRTIIPPPPRTCGARFSHDGRLICFFPTKEEKARALFSSAVEVHKDRGKIEQPFFAGFGRLSHEAPPKQRYNGEETSAAEDHSDTEESMESSSSSSSDSESTSINKMSLWYHPSRQLRKTWSEDRSIRSSGGGTGTGIGTGTGTAYSRKRIGRPRNLVSIHDLRGLLPSKKELAKEYAIFGDGAEVCEHNAMVAAKHGYEDMADIWRYLTLLLRKGIPLEVVMQDNRRSSILVIARDAVAKDRAQAAPSSPDSGFASMYSSDGLSGRVKWGEHPLAQQFIADLLEYFEQIVDIQMLAMLSCIFSETSADDSVAYIESQLPQPETPLPLKAPSFSLEYYPTDASAWNLYGKSRNTSGMTTPRTPMTPYYAASQASEDVTWTGDPASSSYSCGETPPARVKGHFDELDFVQSGAKSPRARAVPKGSNSLASSFTGISRSFTGGSSASPPHHGKKKPSPVETIVNSLAPAASNAVWGNSGGMGDSSVGRVSMEEEEDDYEDTLPLVPVSVSVYVEDQTMFDDDGWLSAPMLESSRGHSYVNYRYAYAEMLQMWDEPLARLEIMKFNVIKADNQARAKDGSVSESFTIQEGSTTHPRTGSSPIVMGKKDQLHALIASGRGLDVTGICRVHETQLDPSRYTSSDARMGGAVGSCDRCRQTQSQLRCVYCLEPVDALFPPCLSCGCASHEACLADWHAAGERVCPAGDECNCVEEAAKGQVESWAALQGAVLKSSIKLSRLPSPAIDDTEEEDRGRRASEPPDTVITSPGGGLISAASPATLSFGRLKKSAGSWSRASSLRRNSKRG